jgi:transcriptional regulator with XRE-family HTH domain
MAKKAKRRGKRFKRDAEIIAAFAANVRRIRKSKRPKLSQEKLAFAANLDRSYVSGVERREKNPTISVLARLARALKVKPAVLVTEPPPETGR